MLVSVKIIEQEGRKITSRKDCLTVELFQAIRGNAFAPRKVCALADDVGYWF
jgi:hypothetical protein